MAELLTGRELARYLKLNPVTVHRKALKGEIPAMRIGRQLRFDKDQIDRWLLQQAVGTSLRILVVDDEPAIGRLLEDFLERYDYQVVAVTSSAEALDLVARSHFDFVFLDLYMPEMDGSQLFRRIREMDRQVPVAIITGYPDSELMKKAMEHGPFLVISKPFESEDILAAIRSYTRGAAVVN